MKPWVSDMVGRGKRSLKPRRWFVGFGLAFVSTVVTLVFAELFVRLWWPQQEAMKWFRTSSEYGYVLKKSFIQAYTYQNTGFVMLVRTNSHGFRDDEIDLTEKAAPRIVFIGDSFFFGHGVNIEDRFDHLMRGKLSLSGLLVQTVNAGTGGWGTIQEVSFMIDHLDDLDPDFVVLGFCGNDPDDDVKFTHGLGDNDRGLVRFPGKRLIKEKSHLYRLLYSEFHHVVHRIYLRRKANEEAVVRFDSQTSSVITDEEWVKTSEQIRRLHAALVSRSKGTRLLVFSTAPWNEQIRETMLSLDNGLNLIFLDLMEETQSLTAEERRLPHDGHWSLRVHQIIAEELADEILGFFTTDQLLVENE